MSSGHQVKRNSLVSKTKQDFGNVVTAMVAVIGVTVSISLSLVVLNSINGVLDLHQLMYALYLPLKEKYMW